MISAWSRSSSLPSLLGSSLFPDVGGSRPRHRRQSLRLHHPSTEQPASPPPPLIEQPASAPQPAGEPGAGGEPVEDYEASSVRLPIWQELTAFEAETVRAVGRSRTPSTESLFKLALMMGGELRTAEQAEPKLQAFDRFLERTKPIVDQESDQWQKGFLLFKEFYAVFLESPGEGGELTNYQLD